MCAAPPRPLARRTCIPPTPCAPALAWRVRACVRADDGKAVVLNSEQEEVATMYAAMMTTAYAKEKVFNDNVSASLFASPSMQRFKRQSDDFFSGVTTSLSDTFSSLATITGVSSVTTGVNSYFKSWFG